MLRSFLLQSLRLGEGGASWRLNLDVLEADMPKIIGWPEVSGQFTGPTLFLRGALSDYVLPDHAALITRLFPHAKTESVEGANHWLHAEKPREFQAAVEGFWGEVSEEPAAQLSQHRAVHPACIAVLSQFNQRRLKVLQLGDFLAHRFHMHHCNPLNRLAFAFGIGGQNR